MTEAAFKEKFAELIQNEDFQEKLGGLTDRADIQNLFLENGLELTEEMLDGIEKRVAYFEETGELDEETLELVAGGFLKHIITGAIIGGASAGAGGALFGAVVGGVTYVVTKGKKKKKKKF